MDELNNYSFFSSISNFRRTKVEGSGPRQWKARVRRSSKSLKSSIILAYSMAFSTHSLYLLLSLGCLSIAQTMDRRVSDDKMNTKRMKVKRLEETMMHLSSGFPTNGVTQGDHPKPRQRESPSHPKHKKEPGLPISEQRR